MLEKVRNVSKRLHAAEVEALGEDWIKSWHKGLTNCETVNDPYQFGQMVWMHNSKQRLSAHQQDRLTRTLNSLTNLTKTHLFQFAVIKSFGMLDFAKDRYGTFDGNLKRWDFEKPASENIQKMIGGWGYMPGVAIEPGKDYTKYLTNVPEKNKPKVLEALQFTFDVCSSSSDKSSIEIPEEWETAYDMRPWNEYPRQKF